MLRVAMVPLLSASFACMSVEGDVSVPSSVVMGNPEGHAGVSKRWCNIGNVTRGEFSCEAKAWWGSCVCQTVQLLAERI